MIVIVTGASAGVGRATAVRFARQGAAVGLVARGQAGLEAAAKEVEAAGGQALILPTDVADAGAVEAVAAEAEAALGPIDVWVNNAMTTVFAPLTDVTPKEFQRATEVTYLGAVWGTMAALGRMLPRDRGTIVQVGSALSYRSIPLQSAYCGAKFALRGFTDSLRTELLHNRSNVRLTMVQLPAINTPQFGWSRAKLPNSPQPVPPIFQPEVAAEAIWWAAHHPRRELWLGARAAMTMLGAKFAPGALDYMLARTGYESQQTDQPLDRERPDYLFTPVDDDRDHGAHGAFDRQARPRSPALQLAMSRPLAGALSRPLGAFLARFFG